MPEMRGKGWRVFGYFLWMAGSGIVLDSQNVALGAVIAASGAVLFAIGVLQDERAKDRISAAVRTAAEEAE